MNFTQNNQYIPMKMLRIALILLAIIMFISCQKDTASPEPDPDPQPITYDIQGNVQKGPYLNGTSITVSELKADLSPTGRTFNAQVLNNLGAFELKNIELSSDFVELKADGFYYNEVLDERSSAQLTLYALADLKDQISTNVNILSTLEKRRVEYLMANGSTFTAAKKQTQAEILQVFEIVKPDIAQSEGLSIAEAGENHAILLALSLIIQGYQPAAELSELLANISADMREDGTLDDVALGSALVNNARLLKQAEIRRNLEAKYQELGGNGIIPPFEKYIDQFLQNTDFPSTETITYPASGKHGINLLDREKTTYAKGAYSMIADLKEGANLKVRIRGINWLFPSFQNDSGWVYGDWDFADNSRTFTSTRTGKVDFEIRLENHLPDTSAYITEIFVYENNAEEVSWSKVINLEE